MAAKYQIKIKFKINLTMIMTLIKTRLIIKNNPKVINQIILIKMKQMKIQTNNLYH